MKVALKFVLTIIVILSSMSFHDGGDGGARIDFVEESHDFGEIEEGAVVEHVFKFSNSGDVALEIKKVKGS